MFAVGKIFYVSVKMDIVKKAVAWFSYKDEKLEHGIDKSKDFLAENPDILKEIEQKVREKLKADRENK